MNYYHCTCGYHWKCELSDECPKCKMPLPTLELTEEGNYEFAPPYQYHANSATTDSVSR